MKRNTALRHSPALGIFSLVVVFSVLLLSCTGTMPTKEWAKKQIDARLNVNQDCEYHLSTVSNRNANTREGMRLRLELNNLKTEGFITFTRDSIAYNQFVYRITVLDKCKPFINSSYAAGASQEYAFSFGNVGARIVSIAEPAPDGSGNIVCNVQYNGDYDLNAFGLAALCTDYNASHPVRSGIATFIKTQDGWRFDRLR